MYNLHVYKIFIVVPMVTTGYVLKVVFDLTSHQYSGIE